MELYQVRRLLHKGNPQQNEEATNGRGDSIYTNYIIFKKLFIFLEKSDI